MKPQIPWFRVFVESVVIVGSILLAFGIDALEHEAAAQPLRNTGVPVFPQERDKGQSILLVTW